MTDEHFDVDRKARVNRLKQQARELSGGEMIEGQTEECPPEIAEEFWQQVVDYEEAPWTTNFRQLEESGLTLPPPDQLGDWEVSAKLWQVIEGLARLRVFLENTDHLSDRELYAWLSDEGLREETKALPYDENSACHLSPIGSGSEEDTNIYLKYYADEEWRRQWTSDFPKESIPVHQNPPYDRDRHLPQAHPSSKPFLDGDS